MNASTALARAAVGALAAAGVREVVLCPGSRSAPVAYALHAADAAGLLRLHVRHDERSAAFTALGAGRVGGPAAVVTTSGTAVANLHPAVLEASEAGVPLVVLTADRPHALRGTWANQTTALQAGLFGAAVRGRLDLPVPAPGEPLARAGATWAAGVADLVGTARGAGGGRPGPVHADLAFAEPLVPDDAWSPDPSGPPGRGGGSGPGAAGAWSGREALAAVGGMPGRTVVVAGDGAGPLARALAEAAGWPLLAEPSSGARGGPCAVGPYRLLLDAPGLGADVERAVVLGRPTLSRPVAALLARDGVEVVQLVGHPGDPGPARAATRLVVPAPPGPSGGRAAGGPADAAGGGPVSERGERGEADGGAWLGAWQRAGRAAQEAVDAVLDAVVDAGAATGAGAGRLSGPVVAREVAAAAREGELLVAAASNAVRDLDLAGAPWAGAGPRVLANRGLAGIDGTVSTASGAALAAGRPTRALVGDLALLHDANGLLLPPGEPEPDLQVVVVDDDGGAIFTGLEHGEPARASTFERLFATPHGRDAVAVAAALGAPARRVADVAGLRRALVAPPRGRSVVVVDADRSHLRELHARLRREVAEAVAAASRASGAR